MHHLTAFRRLTVPAVAAFAIAAAGGPEPSFLGAAAGAPVPFTPLALPDVVVSPFNDPPATAGCAFAPAFAQLVSGDTIITTEAQMRHVWRRLFQATYQPGLFDFDQDFVILMGGGLLHPFINFEITSVEAFEASFADPLRSPRPQTTLGLAAVATTFLPGPPPPDKDPVHKVSAVRVPLEHLSDVIFHRQVLSLP